MRATWLRHRLLSEISLLKTDKVFRLGGMICFGWAGWKEFEVHLQLACYHFEWRLMIIDKQTHEKIS